MGKPDFTVYQSFRNKYFTICGEYGRDQYLIPYLMSSHPGSTLNDAIELALCLKRDRYAPEQVQDFYPTPGTASTVMYYTGIDPLTGKSVYVATSPEEKQMQRALLQYNRPENAELVRRALTLAHREELIGYAPECLIRPAKTQKPTAKTTNHAPKPSSNTKYPHKPINKKFSDDRKPRYSDGNKQNRNIPKSRSKKQ